MEVVHPERNNAEVASLSKGLSQMRLSQPQKESSNGNRHVTSAATASTISSTGGVDPHQYVFYEDDEASVIQEKISRNSNDSRNRRCTEDAVSRSQNKADASSPSGSSDAVADYQFFIQYTYTPECALLAHNFTAALVDMGLFEYFNTLPDHRVMAVQLLYLFYKYQMEHNDMALDLSLALSYIEDAKKKGILEKFDRNDGFNFVMYTTYLAHVWNNDRTICLTDWFKEVGWQTFKKCSQLNGYVLNHLKKLRNYRLRVPTEKMREWVMKLCRAPVLGASTEETLSTSSK